MERSNPFADYGTTVTGARFIGRERELRVISSRVFGAGGFGSIAVVGLPRIGKSSLVSEAIRRAAASEVGRRSAVVRASVGVFDSVDGLFRHLIEELRDAVHDRGLGDQRFEDRVAEALAGPPIDFGAVRRVFHALRRADIRPVVVLDEFDAGRRVFESAPQCFHWLRELCSNPEFKAATVLVAKRRLQDVARLAGHESNYWANVLATLPLKPFSGDESIGFFSKLESEEIPLTEAERREVLTLTGGHPYLLDAFGFRAWEQVRQGGRIDIEWIDAAYGSLGREYFQQVAAVLEDGPMLSKAVQVFVGPQWDVSPEDVEALCELGIALRDEDETLRGFSRLFEEHLRFVECGVDVWTLWRDTERALRDFLERSLREAYGGPDWPSALVRARPKFGSKIEDWKKNRAKERQRFGVQNVDPSLLAYSYPWNLYELMRVDWPRLGEPLLGSDQQGWNVKFTILSKVRTPLAHNRTVDDGDRTQAEGICREILSRYRGLQDAFPPRV